MTTPTTHQLNADLDRVLRCIQDLRQLDCSVDAHLQQALEESRRLLGAITRYRHQLQRLDAWAGLRQRQAA